MWDAHLPKHNPNNMCKVAIYINKVLLKMHTIKLYTDHPLASLTSTVMDVMDANDMTLQIINMYHAVPKQGHSLHYLLSYTLDETIPTLLVSDLNTHDGPALTKPPPARDMPSLTGPMCKASHVLIQSTPSPGSTLPWKARLP